MPTALSTQISVTPLVNQAGFGAEVTNIDLNDMSDSDFEALERALYTHKLLVIKGQEGLLPKKQLELVKRFDPEAKAVHGHGNAKDVMKAFKGKKSLVGANPGVPDEPMVRMIGRGPVEPGHHGVTEPLMLKSGTHKGFHKDPLTDEQIDAGETRFHRWHIDAGLQPGTHPPKVTSLWAQKLPSGPPLTVRWDDGSDLTMKVEPGLTAFLDCAKMYNSLSAKNKAWVDHSRVEYAPSPYQWIQDAKSMSNGFAMHSDGLETPFADLPGTGTVEYPLVWINPFNGEKSLQVHVIVVQRLIKKTSKDGPEEIIDDVAKLRQILYDLQRPFLIPENIVVSPQGEGDMALWYNRGCRHTAIEYPSNGYGDRLCHQVHVVGSDNPAFPKMVQQTA